MIDAPLREVMEAIAHDCCPFDMVREALCALWAVMVLDALGRVLVAKHGPYHNGCDPSVLQLSNGTFTVSWWGSADYRVGEHRSEGAARLAAAEAVFPELPADVRAKLGARP
jgi:hypothetical protein